MKIKNIPRNLSLYSKRTFLWHTNREPFLSGDLFADNADVNVYPYIFRGFQASKKEVAGASVVFCRSDYLERFLYEYRGNINARVLILGNSDRDFENFEFALPKTIRQVFVQNLLFRDSRLSLLPIGLENRRFATNGNPVHFTKSPHEGQKVNRILVGPLSDTHLERRPLVELFYNFEGVDFMQKRLPPTQYIQVAKKYRYIAAPRGNGMDTHRFWESLYLDSLPVVLKSIWSDQIEDLRIPVITVPEWQQSTISKLLNADLPLNTSPISTQAIWWKYWKEKIQSYC